MRHLFPTTTRSAVFCRPCCRLTQNTIIPIQLLHVLCYSVITSGEFAHRGSVENLIGNRTELLEKVSLEKHVSAQTPPAFLWASDNDPSVPCQNSIMFRDALEESGVKNQIHIYRSDFHGLSLGTLEVMNPKKPFKANVSDRPERADKFLQSVFG